MQKRKFRILSAATVGSLALATVSITASSSSSTSPTAKPAALAVQTGSFPPVNLDDCPILHTGYPQGDCVAQLQTDLRIVQNPNLDVDGLFGSIHSQTYNAVIAFQTAHGLKPDGMVGPATKNALEAAGSGSSSGGPLTASADGSPAPSTFNAVAAAQWAAANARNDPASWQSPQRDHCAEFVSQALWEAGMPIDKKSWFPAVDTSTAKKIGKTLKRNLPIFSGGTPSGSAAWENSFALPDYFVNKKHWATKIPLNPGDPASASENGAASGDLIEYDWQGMSNPRDGHLSMVTKVTLNETDVSQQGVVGSHDDQVGRPWSVSWESTVPNEPLISINPHMKAWLIHWNGNDAVSTPTPAPAVSQLDPGQTLSPGESLTSPDAAYTLTMQPDGNLVEYAGGQVPIWSSDTAGNPGTVLEDQSDGNIVLVASGNVPIWSTHTNGRAQTALLLQDDGNLVAYAEGNVAVWASRSQQTP